MGDMTGKVMEDTVFGGLALAKMGEVPENFRLYSASRVGVNLQTSIGVEVLGAEFRRAKSGKNRGMLSIEVPGTRRAAFVSNEEIQAVLAKEES